MRVGSKEKRDYDLAKRSIKESELDPFVHLPILKVVICSMCQYALSYVSASISTPIEKRKLDITQLRDSETE